MATWTAIPNASLEPGAPARSIDAIALRDNVTALAEGSSGAPRVADAALSTSVTTTGRDWVLNRNATADVGAVGTYALLFHEIPTSTTEGTTVAGGLLRYANTYDGDGSLVGARNSAPAGTWRLMGATGYYYDGTSYSASTDIALRASLWLRIS